MGTSPESRRLMVIGGGMDTEGRMEILREFVEMAGGPKAARVVVMAAASTDPKEQDEMYRSAFGRLGVSDFRLLETESRDDANKPKSVDVVEGATGIFFTGGDQKRLRHVLHDTKLEAALRRKVEQGVVVAGTSAGASMMSETMLNEGESAECARKGMVTLAQGMGYLPEMIIDQHFSQRGRIGRLLAAVAERPELLGVGLGEDTAMIVEGGRFRVIGRGVATVLDATPLRVNDSDARRKDEPLTLSGLILHTVGMGHVFDIEGRRVVADESEGNS